MIAIFRVLLPFDLYVPKDLDQAPIALEDESHDMRINVLPPYASTLKPSDIQFKADRAAFNLFQGLVKDPNPQVTGNVMIDGAPTVVANCLQLDFYKTVFDRKKAFDEKTAKPLTDPPIELVFDLVNGVLDAFRAVGKANFIRPIAYNSTFWVLNYRNDDLSELPAAKDLARMHMGASFGWQVFGLGVDLWNEVRSKLLTVEHPTWERLYMDAISILPEIGPAIVLSFSSIETLTSIALDFLAKGKLPEDLWDWITERKPYFHRPNTEQMLDVIMRSLTGESLRAQPALWEAFQQLNKARNNFAHRGELSVDGAPMDLLKATDLITKTGLILDWIEAKLPDSKRRYKPSFQTKLELTKILHEPSN